MGLNRGDIVMVGLRGDLGKPRPAVIVQTDLLPPTDHVLLCPLTSEVRDGVVKRRVSVAPSLANGLKLPSQVMVDKLNLARRGQCGKVIARLDRESMGRVNAALALVVGLLDDD